MLKANTVKSRSYSMFRQGMHDYPWLANWDAAKIAPLVLRFGELLAQQAFIVETFSSR